MPTSEGFFLRFQLACELTSVDLEPRRHGTVLKVNARQD